MDTGRWRKHYVKDRILEDWKAGNEVDSNGKDVIKVISDIDDTICCSGGQNFLWLPISGGIDQRFYHGVAYPGAYQFGLELARSCDSEYGPLRVSVATARPRELEPILGLKENHRVALGYRRCGELNGLHDWGLGERLYGCIIDWLFLPRTGHTKYENIIDLSRRVDPGVKFVFIGDTGQYDPVAGMKLLHELPERMRALFLHVVHTEEEVDEACVRGRPIIYFRTYVGAAVKAWQHRLLCRKAMLNVSCHHELLCCTETSSQIRSIFPDLGLRRCLPRVHGTRASVSIRAGPGALTGSQEVLDASE